MPTGNTHLLGQEHISPCLGPILWIVELERAAKTMAGITAIPAGGIGLRYMLDLVKAWSRRAHLHLD